MKAEELSAALATRIDRRVASNLVEHFLALRQDATAGTLGRASAGKFVEVLVQAFQSLNGEQIDRTPKVDEYLRKAESVPAHMSDGLRICGARVARAMYSIRSKRVVHISDIEANAADVAYLHQSAQWLMAELLREVTGSDMDSVAALVRSVRAPVGGLIEDFGGRRVVLAPLPARAEALVLLHSHYPEPVTLADIAASMRRRSRDTVRKLLKALWKERLVEGDAAAGYRLTRIGLETAIDIIRSQAA